MLDPAQVSGGEPGRERQREGGGGQDRFRRSRESSEHLSSASERERVVVCTDRFVSDARRRRPMPPLAHLQPGRSWRQVE